MPRYFPINAGILFECSKSDLLKIDWSTNHLAAEFILPEDNSRSLRVSFDANTIVRLLDEMPLSIEVDPSDNEGLIPDHFAYRVEGSLFAETQSDAWKEIMAPVSHYEFITGSGCMDVLSPTAPSFEIVPTDMAALQAHETRWERIQAEC